MYTLFTDKAVRVTKPTVAITTQGRFALNANAGDLLRSARAKYVQILWDEKAQKIAFRPVLRADANSYRLTSTPGKRGMYLTATAFVRSIGLDMSKRRRLPATWNEKEKALEVKLVG